MSARPDAPFYARERGLERRERARAQPRVHQRALVHADAARARALSNSLDSDDSPGDDAASVARLARLLEDGAVDDESMWRHQYACLDMDKLIAASQPPAPTEVLAAIAITASANPDSKGARRA